MKNNEKQGKAEQCNAKQCKAKQCIRDKHKQPLRKTGTCTWGRAGFIFVKV